MNHTLGENEDGLLAPETKISFYCQIRVTSHESIGFDKDEELRFTQELQLGSLETESAAQD